MILKDYMLYSKPDIRIYAKKSEVEGPNELELSDAVGEALNLLEKELKAMGFIAVIDE